MKFTIRDLLWLTVVVALAVLWWGEIRQRKIENAEVWRDNLMLRNERNALAMELARASGRGNELEHVRSRRDSQWPNVGVKAPQARSL